MSARPPMARADWSGVFPAITTPFRADGSVDAELFGQHAAWMVGAWGQACGAAGGMQAAC